MASTKLPVLQKCIIFLCTLLICFYMSSGHSQASASDLHVSVQLDCNDFTSPSVINIDIQVKNNTDKEIGPIELYDDAYEKIESFYVPSLAQRATYSWSGPFSVTQEHLEAGTLSFILKFTDSSGDTIAFRCHKSIHYETPVCESKIQDPEIVEFFLPNFGNGEWRAEFDEDSILLTVDTLELDQDTNSSGQEPEVCYYVTLKGVSPGESNIDLSLIRGSFVVTWVDLSIEVDDDLRVFIQSIEVVNAPGQSLSNRSVNHASQ